MQQLLQRASFSGRYGMRPRSSLSALDPKTGGYITSGASVASGAAIAAGLIPAAAVPFIGPAIAGIALGIQAIINSGCGQSCVITSNWANEAEDLLRQNIDAYFKLPSPRYASAQQVALANFDKVWNYLYQECSNPQLSTAGQNCINDRKAGACKWKQSGESPWPGGPTLGQCWNWFAAYRDPIANDPVQPDPTPTSEVGAAVASAGDAVSQVFSSVGSALQGVSPMLLVGGVLLVMAMAGGEK